MQQTSLMTCCNFVLCVQVVRKCCSYKTCHGLLARKEGSPLNTSGNCGQLAYVQLINKIGPDLQKLFLLACLPSPAASL